MKKKNSEYKGRERERERRSIRKRRSDEIEEKERIIIFLGFLKKTN